MAADWLERLGHDSWLVRAIGSWQLIGLSDLVRTADWLQQLGHGSRLVTAIGSWQLTGYRNWVKSCGNALRLSCLLVLQALMPCETSADLSDAI